MEQLEPKPHEQPSTIPSPLQSLGMFAAAMLVHQLGLVVVLSLGAPFMTAEQRESLSDPNSSILLTDPIWLAVGVAVPLALVGVGLFQFARHTNLSLDEVFPVRVPGAVSFIGALMVVFGLAPLADVTHNAVALSSWQSGDTTAAEIVAHAIAGASWSQVIALVIGVALFPAVVEEALFRGFVTAAHRKSFWSALLAPTVLFALFHLEPAHVAGMIVLGLGFGAARLFSGSLLAPMVAHATYNAVVIVATAMNSEVASSPPTAASVGGGLLIAVLGVLLLPMGRVRPVVSGDAPSIEELLTDETPSEAPVSRESPSEEAPPTGELPSEEAPPTGELPSEEAPPTGELPTEEAPPSDDGGRD